MFFFFFFLLFSQPTISTHKPALTKKLSTDASCDETMYQAPPTLFYNSADKDWQSDHSSHLGYKVWKELQTGKEQVIDYDTRPVTTVGMRGDGNCFFRTLSFFLTGSQSQHGRLWTQIVKSMTEYNSQFSAVAGEEDYATTSAIASPGEYGTEVEIYAAASLLATPDWCESLALAMLSANSRVASVFPSSKNACLLKTGQSTLCLLLSCYCSWPTHGQICADMYIVMVYNVK